MQALSNLCLDIVVEVPQLPPADEPARRALLQQLTAHPPPQNQWEVGAGRAGQKLVPGMPPCERSLGADRRCCPALQVGGNTNFLVAASRLGLKTASVGHLVCAASATAAC